LYSSVPEPLRLLSIMLDPHGPACGPAFLERAPPPHEVELVTPARAAEAVADADFDAVLIEPGCDCSQVPELVAELRASGFDGAFVVLAASAASDADQVCLRAGVSDYLDLERTDASSLDRSLRYAVAHARTRVALERSNAELERFAAAVSHDLRQPLHLISGYAELLEGSSGSRLAADAMHALRQVQFGAARMNELIEDLLVYARLNRGRRQREAVDMRFVLELVERELGESIKASGATVERGMLPVVQGYTALLEQLLRNLVSNAIKFAGDNPPRVFVGAESRGDVWLFCVRDQGPGIPAAYHDCLFDVFTRGPQRDEVEGTGIGLAICKKAVQDHRGRIWLESGPDRGTTVRFTLPRRNSRC
jgi:signal transduction histidine kinase